MNIEITTIISEGHLGLFTKIFAHKNKPLYGIHAYMYLLLQSAVFKCQSLTCEMTELWKYSGFCHKLIWFLNCTCTICNWLPLSYMYMYPTCIHSLCSCSQDGGQSVDERLLSSLVQDVWDKFCNQRTLLLTRQRNEAEAMWMLQHQQWTDRLKDLGEWQGRPASIIQLLRETFFQVTHSMLCTLFK